jgi:hypothetical protein
MEFTLARINVIQRKRYLELTELPMVSLFLPSFSVGGEKDLKWKLKD